MRNQRDVEWVIRLVAGTVLVFMLYGVSQAESGRDPYQYFFDESFGDFQEELAITRGQGKKYVLIFFEMEDCPFCYFMKQNVLNQVEVQNYFRKHFRSFAVDIEGDIEIRNMKGETVRQKDFAFKDNRVRATPAIAFFDLEGNRVFRYTGKTSGIEEFMWMGEYVVGNIYKKMPFSKYVRIKRKQD